VPRAGIPPLIGAVLGALAVVCSVPAVAAAAAGAAPAGPAQIGPYRISAQARPDLCWQAAGNGSPVTLAPCGSAEGQQWTLTSNGVLMNGNGYCLQAGAPLLIGFDGQCDGEPGQLWSYRGTTGQLASRGSTDCTVLSGPLAPGTAVADGACDGGTRWSFGSAAGAPVRSAAPQPATTPHRVSVQVPAQAATPAATARTSWAALPIGALLAGLLLVTGATLVFFGRRSRTASGRHSA
jgi:hypothetical protein